MGIGSEMQEVSLLQSERSKKKPRKPEQTAEQLALEKRQQAQLDKETAENERRLKQLARGKLGAESLLSGTEPTQQRMATRAGPAASGGGGSLLGGVSVAGGGGGSKASTGSAATRTSKAR